MAEGTTMQQQPEGQLQQQPEVAGRGYVRVLGLAAGGFSLLQALVAASAARSAQSSVLAYQRSLVTDYTGGGVSIDPLLGPLLKLFAITYVTNLMAFAVTLGFAWYAGRIAALLRGSIAGGAGAGTTVTAISSAVWLFVTLLAALLFHADGSIAWLIATLALTPGGAQSGLLITAPSPAFVGIQAAVLLVQAFVGIGPALALGALAGRLGAESRSHGWVTPARA
jgi:hypothetical protein